jgi:hypothetical protein
MDEKIFVREQENNSGLNVSPMIVIGVAVILVIVGVIGIFSVLNNNPQNTSEPEIEEPVLDNEEDSNTSTSTTDNPNESVSTTNENSDTEPSENNEETEEESPNQTVEPETPVVFGPPSDETKFNAYFVKNGSLSPVIREKPEEYLNSQIIASVINGPTSEELSDGFSDSWDFVGTSTCERNATFQWSGGGNTITVNLCKEISASNPNLFKEALRQSISEQTSFTNVVVINPDGSTL